MGLRIANNITAMNAHRWLTASDSGMAKSLERLSSGYRINRAADDAAGLAISQSFRADIASFRVASRNTTEASALLQVAEGGMDQIGNMLTRLKELATQAASANVGATERTKINAEGNQLISEIDRIANSTKYGSTALLDGTFGATNTPASYTYSTATLTGSMFGIFSSMAYVYSVAVGATSSPVFSTTAAGLTVTGLASTLSAQTFTFSAGATLKIYNGVVSDVASISWTQTSTQTIAFQNLGITISLTMSGVTSASWCSAELGLKDTAVTNLNTSNATTGVYEFSPNAAAGVLALVNTTTGIRQQISNLSPGTAATVDFDVLGVSFSLGTNYTENDLEAVSFTVSSSGTGSTFQIGAKDDTNNQISLAITGVTASTLNTNLVVDSLDTQGEAQDMLTYVDSAVSALNTARGTIGASMNRLGYAAANLATTIENVQAAESVIRDVDMAAEMTTFTKNQILLQAGTAMLAQANMAPQSILSLIGG